ncbi:lysophospholipid acyltransferase family protein [Silvimonas iriomotensis]|uniref:Acyltransferase n=1 Tax=Silvimonas iriomotensis TaxID=449662 RepID=A0ABQ2PA88_9NEIS|nr:lysophospholipid acyltransferase family protein [Silvimonas iriomotensis]GGP21760.1 acyltransferase [Silvimonas iriomotensis]
MKNALSRWWRAAVFGLCFALFGLGCALIGLFLWPLSLLLPRHGWREKTAKNFIRRAIGLFVWIMQMTGAMNLTVQGAEKLQREGLLVLANHPSLIDVVILMSLIPRPDCVVKAALWRNPVTAGPVRLAGYISNATGPQLVADAVSSMERGNNLIVFPEGTRTVPGGDMRFQRGAANIAVRGQRLITPVVITVSEQTLTKGSKWYRPPPRRPHFHVEVLDDVAVGTLVAGTEEPALQARWLTTWLEQFFKREITGYGPADR